MSGARHDVVAPADHEVLDPGAATGHAWPWLIAIVLLTGAVHVALQPEPHWGDAQRVFWYAATWPDVPTDHHALRIGLLAPIRIAIVLFGPGSVAYAVTAFTLTCVLTLGTFLAGRELFGTRVGAGATVLLLATPFLAEPNVFLTTGHVLPDVPAGGFIALGVAATLVGLRSTGPRARTWLILAGVAFAYGYLVREFVAAMFLVVPLLAWTRHRPLRSLLPTVTTMVVVFVGEVLVNTVVHGMPLARLTVAAGHGGVQPEPVSASDAIFRPWSLVAERPAVLAIIAMTALLVVAVAVVRDRRLILCLVWFGSFWVTLVLLGGILDPVTPHLRTFLARYWTPAVVPLAIGSVGAASLLLAWMRQRGLSPTVSRLVGSVLVVAALLYVAASASLMARHEPQTAWSEVRSWLMEAQPERVVTDNRSRDRLAFAARDPLGQRVWDGCIDWYWHGHGVVPLDRDGVILHTETSPRLDEDLEFATLFTSGDGRLRVVDVTGGTWSRAATTSDPLEPGPPVCGD